MVDAKQVEVVLEANEALAVIPGKGSMLQHGQVAYDTGRDELVVTISAAAVLRVRPGRSFAESVGVLMTRAEAEQGSGHPAATPCAGCGEAVLMVAVGISDYETSLDAEPSQAGIYVLTRPGRARTLRALESPLGAVYRKHRCPGGR